MRIATFISTVPGGSLRTFKEYVRLLSRDNEIEVYTLNEDCLLDIKEWVKSIYPFKFEYLFFKKPFGFFNIFLNFLNLFRLDRLYHRIANLINRKNYDITFIHQSYYLYIHCPGIVRFLKIPYVYYCQEPVRLFYERDLIFLKKMSAKEKFFYIFLKPFYRLFAIFFKLYDAFNIKRCNFLLCNSYYSKNYILNAYHKEAELCYLGVDTNKFKPLTDVKKENLVISVGHLEPRKGHDFVIQAIGKIPFNLRPKIIIVYPCYEDVEYKRYLKIIAEKNNVCLEFFCGISDEELTVLYNKAKLTVCAFVREAFGLIPLESLACGTPVLAVNEAGLKESIIHNKTGLLVERDIEKFSEALCYLLKEDKLREEMGEYGRQYILEKWKWENSVDELKKYFLKCLNKK